MQIRSNVVTTLAVALLAAALAAVAVLLLFPSKGTTASSTYSSLVRLAAQYDSFGGEFSTEEEPSDNAAGGQAIFETAVFAPSAANVLYVTVSGTSDVHSSATLQLACLVNNVPCNNGEQGASDGPSGWITLMNVGGNDWHDNNVYYTWCKAITPGTGPRHIQLKMASSNGGTVYMETAHFFVDASTLAPHGCDQANTPEGAGGGETSSQGHGG
jgi:hypothetical protein